MGYPPQQYPQSPQGHGYSGYGPPQGPHYGGHPQGPPPRSGMGAGMIILIIAGAFVLLGGVGVVGYLLLFRGGPAEPERSEPPAAAPQEEPEPAPAEDPVPEEYSGIYEGFMTQYDGELQQMGDEIDLTLDLPAGEPGATGELWQSGEYLCTWELEVVEDLGDEGLLFEAVVTEDPTPCVVESTLIVAPNGDDVEVFWEGTLSSGDQSTASGLLTREN